MASILVDQKLVCLMSTIIVRRVITVSIFSRLVPPEGYSKRCLSLSRPVCRRQAGASVPVVSQTVAVATAVITIITLAQSVSTQKDVALMHLVAWSGKV